MIRKIGVCLVALVAIYGGVSAYAQEGNGFSDLPTACGDTPISIARMQWPTAVLLAQIHAQILEQEYECDVQIVSVDPTAAGSGMIATGQPAVVPELWISRIAELWNSGLESQMVRQAGPSFSGGALEGWFIPQFVAREHPGLTSVAALENYWQEFRTSDQGKAKFISCPPDWACSIINRNMLRALKLDDRFEIVEPANRFELDSLIGEAMSKRVPILFYYWQPNAVLAQFEFLQLDMGAYNQEAVTCLGLYSCDQPTPSAFAPEPVVIALAQWVSEQVPQVAGYFQRAQMPIAEMNALLAWQNEQSKTAEETAAHFVKSRSEIWRAWLSIF